MLWCRDIVIYICSRFFLRRFFHWRRSKSKLYRILKSIDWTQQKIDQWTRYHRWLKKRRKWIEKKGLSQKVLPTSSAGLTCEVTRSSAELCHFIIRWVTLLTSITILWELLEDSLKSVWINLNRFPRLNLSQSFQLILSNLNILLFLCLIYFYIWMLFTFLYGLKKETLMMGLMYGTVPTIVTKICHPVIFEIMQGLPRYTV